MDLRFSEPLWLLVALLIVPTAWVGLRWLHAMSRARAWSAVMARAALLALLALMLAGAASVRRTDRLAVIVVVDTSESVRRFATVGDGAGGERPALEAVRSWIERAGESRRPDDLLGVVAFDGRALALSAPSARGAGDLEFDVALGEGTDLEGALRYARALIPPGASGRIVLVSDGVETSGDALLAADALAGGESPVPVDVLPLAYNVSREAMVESVDAPPSAAEEATVTVRVTLRAESPTRGTLRLLREGQELDVNGASPGYGRRVEFGPGRRIELFQVRLDEGRVHRFEAIYEPDADARGELAGDTLLSNNRAEAFTVTPGRGMALVIDGVSDGDPEGEGATLANTLEAAGILVRTVPPGAAPRDLLALQAYDLVMLQNVAAEELSQETQALLADYVEELGGGLVMIGGPDSFGAGGWKGSALEAVLPVGLDLPEQLITPSAAIVIVLDASGSMSMRVMGGTRSQQQIANEGAALAIRSLDKQDLVGVLSFSNNWRVVVPLGPNADPEGAMNRVRAIGSSGGTNMYPALDEAGRMLMGVEAQVRHVILLSDGMAMGDPSSGPEIARRLNEQGITVSTIAVGDGADSATLSAIAYDGGGEFYRVVDPNVLPRIFLKETRVVRRPLIREVPFTPVSLGSGSPLTLGMPREAPELGGLVLTQRREEPGVVNVLAAPSGEPLLAHWNVGLGQVGAFTSDAHHWARQWIDWPGYRQMWTQVARALSRPSGGQGFDLAAEVEGDTLRLRLEARDRDGRPIDLLRVPGTLFGPDGSRQSVQLSQVGPGEYEARVRAPGTGNYVVALTPRLGEKAMSPVVGGVSRATGPELRRLRSDVATLRRIADATGGRALDLSSPETANLFDRAGVRPSQASSPLLRLLLVWAVVVTLLDVGTRRVAWDRLISREAAAELARLAGSLRGKGDAAATSVGALRRAREGASRRAEPSSGGPSPAPAGPVPLATGPTAEEVRRAAQSALRDAAVRAPGGSGGSAGVGEGSGGDDRTSSLLAAKRRARERFSDEEGKGGEGAGSGPGG
ncbi:MAG: VWA domain-containing protein, partial [Phycisphaerales bacterium]|nr:VWA domain-containing protein [Phycisphaerales bacterium]